jgi:hypothetical protein
VILAYYDGEWVDAQRAAAGRTSCSLGVRNGAEPWAKAHAFEHYIYRTFWHKHFATTDGIRFFPEIRYRGCKVYPVWWHRESSEPLLAVHLPPRDLDFSNFFVRPPKLDDLQRAMEADGWQGDGREGWHKYVHVDELEKIEGPPPEGPF